MRLVTLTLATAPIARVLRYGFSTLLISCLKPLEPPSRETSGTTLAVRVLSRWENCRLVVDTGVMVIGHGSGECNLDIRAHGGRRKAIDEAIVGIVVGA
jgi:hypothetical protein